MKKKNNDNFMTETEKSFVAHNLVKNLKKQLKHKDYSIFFTGAQQNPSENMIKKHTKNTKSKIDPITDKKDKITDLEESIKSCDVKKTAKEKSEKKSAPKKEKISLKEILKTSFIRTNKKSSKKPRIITRESIELSETLRYKLKIEELYDELVYQIYIEKNEDPLMVLNEDDLFFFLDIPKFYSYSKKFFKTYNDVSKTAYLLCLLKYAIKIQDIDVFSDFIAESYKFFPILKFEDILKSEYFDGFYFNASNVVLARYLLLSNEHYASFFYDCLSNDNLELIFSLDNDYIAWQFLAVFIDLINDDKQAVIVSLIKERVLETVGCNNNRKKEGLKLFLDAIGIDMKDLQ